MENVKKKIIGSYLDSDNTLLTLSSYYEDADDVIYEIAIAADTVSAYFLFEKKDIPKLIHDLNVMDGATKSGKERNF